MIALSSSPEKLEAAERLGAAHVLDSNDPDWDVKVRELTGGHGADHVVDVVGASTIVRSLNATRQGGLVTAVGFLSGSEKHDLIPDIIFGAKTGMWPPDSQSMSTRVCSKYADSWDQSPRHCLRKLTYAREYECLCPETRHQTSAGAHFRVD